MSLNITTIKTSSDGAWQGDNPLNYAFPLLILQTILVLFISRLLAFLLKPLRQPKVIAEILGGILLGPSALGRNEEFFKLLFPSWSTPILESVASVGLLFFLFLVGLELDLSSICRSGKRAFSIALAGSSLPFLFGIGISFFLQSAVHGDQEKVGCGQHLFVGIALSITAFPVLSRVLAELKLLTTQVGQTAMAAAAFNDVAAWILLALAVAVTGNGSTGDIPKNPLTSVYVLISSATFVGFMLVFIRPMMTWIAKRCSTQQDILDEAHVFLTLVGVMLSGFITDLIGIHSIFGAFVFGLMIPNGGEFATRLIKRIEDFVSGLLLPLYFASNGLKTDVAKMKGVEAWGLLVLVISTACTGKILGTFVMAMLCTVPARASLALGVLMNTKGLVELVVLNIGKEKKVLNDELFTILVLMALFTTFMTTPTVMAIYKPSRHDKFPETHHRSVQQTPNSAENCQEEIRILACIRGPGPGQVPALLINLIKSTSTALKLYVMHLVELTDRSSSITMAQRTRKNGFPLIDRFHQGTSNDRIEAAFAAYGQLGQVTIHQSTSVSALSTMHEDICHVAEETTVDMIILPFHQEWRGDGEEATEIVRHGWQEVNESVLKTARCSVVVLVDRGFGGSNQEVGPAATMPKRACIMFFGGADDRKALELGSRMAENPAVSVTLKRFIFKADLVEDDASSADCLENRYSCSTSRSREHENEKELDEAAVEQFSRKCNGRAEIIKKEMSNIIEELLIIGQSTAFELLVVGKGEMAANLTNHKAQHPELGLLGDILASSEYGIKPSVMVVQYHNFAHAYETISKVV